MKKSADSEDTAASHSLSAYLHSHLTAASAGERLFEQAAKSWRDTSHAGEVGRLAAEVSEDKRALEEICEQLHSSMPAYKKPVAWAGAQVAALDPLNPLHSIEGAKGQLSLSR